MNNPKTSVAFFLFTTRSNEGWCFGKRRISGPKNFSRPQLRFHLLLDPQSFPLNSLHVTLGRSRKRAWRVTQEISEIRPRLHYFHRPALGSESIDHLTAKGSFLGAKEENECLSSLSLFLRLQPKIQGNKSSILYPVQQIQSFFLYTPKKLLMPCLDCFFFLRLFLPL